jgi:hypothetical protein
MLIHTGKLIGEKIESINPTLKFPNERILACTKAAVLEVSPHIQDAEVLQISIAFLPAVF